MMPFMTVWYRFTKSGSEVFHNNAFPASHGAAVPFLYHGFFLSTLLKHKFFYIKIQFPKFNVNNCQMRKTAIPIKNIFVKKTGKFLKKVRCAEKKKSQCLKNPFITFSRLVSNFPTHQNLHPSTM